MSPCLHKTQVPISIILCLAEPQFYNSEKLINTTGDLINKVFTSTLDIVDMQEKIKNAEYIIKQIHVTPINVALNYVKKVLKELTWRHLPL